MSKINKQLLGEFVKFLKDLEIADAIINRDGILFNWFEKKLKEQEEKHQGELREIKKKVTYEFGTMNLKVINKAFNKHIE